MEEDILSDLKKFDEARIDDITKFLDSSHALPYHQYILNLLANATTIKLLKVIETLFDKECILLDGNEDVVKIKLNKEGKKLLQDVINTPLDIDTLQFLNREIYEQSKLKVRNMVEDRKVENIKHSKYPHTGEEGYPQPKEKKEKKEKKEGKKDLSELF